MKTQPASIKLVVLIAFAWCLGVSLLGCSDPGKAAAQGISESAPPEDQICGAAIAGDLDKVKKLLETDSTLIDAVSADGKTPLHFAAAYGQNSVVSYLLEKGADIGAEDDLGESPIDFAVQNGHKDTAKIIIEFSKAQQAQDTAPQS